MSELFDTHVCATDAHADGTYLPQKKGQQKQRGCTLVSWLELGDSVRNKLVSMSSVMWSAPVVAVDSEGVNEVDYRVKISDDWGRQ